MDEELVQRLRNTISNLRERNGELERENEQLRSQLGSAEFRIRNELEPRIQSDRRAYDNWALDPARGA